MGNGNSEGHADSNATTQKARDGGEKEVAGEYLTVPRWRLSRRLTFLLRLLLFVLRRFNLRGPRCCRYPWFVLITLGVALTYETTHRQR